MSGKHHSAANSQAAEAAAAWFVRLEHEAATGDDWLAFEQWLAASPSHAEAYARLERLSVELDTQAPALVEALAARERRASRPARPLLRRAWPAAAAAAIAVVAVVVGQRLETSPPAPETVYAAAPAQIRQIALADGTAVRLDADSKIAVSLGAHQRRVAMADGEAAFDVAHDPARPFLIAVGDRQVRVVGTEFDLRHREGETRLTVRRGVVEVRPLGQPDAAPIRVSLGHELVHRDGHAGSMLAAVDANDAFGWTEGQLIYRDRPMSEVAADVGRRFGIKVRLADAATGEVRFTGVLVTDSAPAVLRRLRAFTGVQARPEPGGYVLSRDGGGK